jgi:anti-sigma factor RsiW
MIDRREASQTAGQAVTRNAAAPPADRGQMSDEDALDEMACQELVEVITDYIEGTLPERDRMRLDAHIAGCASCRAYIEQMRQTMRAVGRLAGEDLEPATRSRLLDAFRAWRQAAD